MNKHFMSILVGVAVLVISAAIVAVAHDHSVIVVHTEQLEDVKKLDVAVNDLRQSNTDIKVSVSEIKTEMRSIGEKTGKIEEAVNRLQADRTSARRSR